MSTVPTYTEFMLENGRISRRWTKRIEKENGYECHEWTEILENGVIIDISNVSKYEGIYSCTTQQENTKAEIAGP